MDKVVNEEIKHIRKKHNIYCDNCEKLIAVETEYEDGYYPDHIFNLQLYVDGWLDYKKQLCDECRIKVQQQIREGLLDLGFEYS